MPNAANCQSLNWPATPTIPPVRYTDKETHQFIYKNPATCPMSKNSIKKLKSAFYAYYLPLVIQHYYNIRIIIILKML